MAPRIAYYTNEAFAQRQSDGIVYLLARITEDEAGYTVHSTGKDLTELQATARAMNATNGLSQEDVADIVASSMRLGPIR